MIAAPSAAQDNNIASLRVSAPIVPERHIASQFTPEC
jgi:hypothetical protein